MEDIIDLTRNLILSTEENDSIAVENQSCNELLAAVLDLGQTCIKEDNEEHRQELYVTWLTALELVNERVANLSTLDQLHVVQVLESLLLSDEYGSQEQRIDMIQTTGWDLVRLLAPYVAGSCGSEEKSIEVRAGVLRLLDAVTQYSNARELYLMVLQTMNSINWDVDLEDLDSAVEGTVLFSVLNRMLATGRIKTKQLVRFIVSPIKAQIPVLELIEQLLQSGYGSHIVESSNTDGSRTGKSWDEILKVLIGAVLDFTNFATGTLTGMEQPAPINAELVTEVEQRQYIVCYHVLNVFEHIISVLPTEFARSYYMRRHKKYDMKSFNPSAQHQPATEKTENFISHTIHRCMIIVQNTRLPLKMIANTIALSQRESANSDDTDAEEEDDTVRFSSFPWSEEGAIAILATAIALQDKEEYSKTNDISFLFSGLIRTTDVLENFGLCLVQSLNKKFTGVSQEECTWIGLFQFLATLIYICSDEASVYLLIEILKNCPFETLRAAAIGFTKQQIDNSLRRFQENKDFSSIYISPLVPIEFFPVIFKYDAKKMVSSESQFWDSFSTCMQAINFYYFLLISDDKSKLVGVELVDINVRSKENIAFVKQNFLQNVRATLEHYLQVYDEKEKELSSKASLKPDGNVALHSTSFEPVVRIELSEGTDHNLSVDEELETDESIYNAKCTQ
ncbi:hypothetical protein Unana1_08539 [Umbelopsis nana]